MPDEEFFFFLGRTGGGEVAATTTTSGDVITWMAGAGALVSGAGTGFFLDLRRRGSGLPVLLYFRKTSIGFPDQCFGQQLKYQKDVNLNIAPEASRSLGAQSMNL